MNISLRIKQIITVSLFVVVLALIYRFRGVLPIFILALFLAYILTPLVVWISSKKVFKRHIPRGVSIIFLYLVIITSVSFGGAYFVINLTNEIQLLVKDIPSYSKSFSEKWVPSVSKGIQNIAAYLPKVQQTQNEEEQISSNEIKALPKTSEYDSQNDILKFLQNTRFEVKQGKAGFEIIPHKITKVQLQDDIDKFDFAQYINEFVADFTENLQSILLGFLDFGQAVVFSVISSIFQTFITLMVAAFIIIDHEQILDFFRGLFPERFLSRFDIFLQKQNIGLHGVVRGQLIICLVNGTLTGIGLLIFDIKFALTLSLLATVTSLIPIFGVFISSVPILLMALTNPNGIFSAFAILAWILLIHFIEGNILNPKIIGKSAEIHPVLVILALMAGEKAAGIFGALVAVPLFSILQTSFIFIREIVFAEGSPLDELQPVSDEFSMTDMLEKPIFDE
ncbi:MAG: AI-2E family transporter [Proteobacteria bacterium]|nr:AI-2E family transporter [Pseudomonadota bacterium]